MSEEKVLTPNSEPLFTVKISACEFTNLTMEQLTEKLQLLRKMNLRHFYHIIEQEGKWIPKPKEPPKV